MHKLLTIVGLVGLSIAAFSQATSPNYLTISLLGKSDVYFNNNTGIGISYERFVTKNRIISLGLVGEYYTPSKYIGSEPSPHNQTEATSFTNNTWKLGLKTAIHWQKGKFDLYAGAQLSLRNDRWNYGLSTSHLNRLPVKSFYFREQNTLQFEPYIGLRYSPVPKLYFQIEAAQKKLGLGLGVNF
jgi:hypothetical protein